MRRLVAIVALSLMCLVAGARSSSAQVTSTVAIIPSQTYALSWDAATPASTLAEDQVVAYVLVAASTAQTGAGVSSQYLKTWTLANVLTTTIPGTDLPTVPFFLSVVARSQSGQTSDHSNTLSFQLPGKPIAPKNLRRTPGQ